MTSARAPGGIKSLEGAEIADLRGSSVGIFYTSGSVLRRSMAGFCCAEIPSASALQTCCDTPTTFAAGGVDDEG